MQQRRVKRALEPVEAEGVSVRYEASSGDDAAAVSARDVRARAVSAPPPPQQQVAAAPMRQQQTQGSRAAEQLSSRVKQHLPDMGVLAVQLEAATASLEGRVRREWRGLIIRLR